VLPVVAFHINENKFQNASINDVIAIIVYTIYFCFKKIQPDAVNVNTNNSVEYLELKKGCRMMGKC
jgi:hypothetical protein